jgi:hypothetical protein
VDSRIYFFFPYVKKKIRYKIKMRSEQDEFILSILFSFMSIISLLLHFGIIGGGGSSGSSGSGSGELSKYNGELPG